MITVGIQKDTQSVQTDFTDCLYTLKQIRNSNIQSIYYNFHFDLFLMRYQVNDSNLFSSLHISQKHLQNILNIDQVEKQTNSSHGIEITTMDIFQLIGDFLHLVAVLMLVLKILANKNVIGLSYKTQQLYLAVFLFRYIDIFTGWKTLYLFLMKVMFISLTAYTMYLMRIKRPYNLSYGAESDSLPHYYVYGGALLMAVLIHKSLNPMDFIWSFSIWLEAFAILPQLTVINKLKDIQNITAHYVLFLGLYRIFYIFHWIFHWEHLVWTSFIAGIIQSLLYADFIYYFVKSNQNDKIIKFPV